jgi:ATP-dependent exoDNAse (exonuclease V) alpha subunit
MKRPNLVDLQRNIFKGVKENYRQNEDSNFANFLLRIRNGTYTKDDICIINSRLLKNFKNINMNNIINLVSHNKVAHVINEQELNKIKEKTYIYEAEYIKIGNESDMAKKLQEELKYQFTQKGINSLSLKCSTRVMLLKNIDVEKGLVNGALGTIDKINNNEIHVKFDNGINYIVTKVTWDLEVHDTKVSAIQIPLIPAYALTHHKVQSLSLDTAILDLKDCFCEHQIYVALSRLRNIENLYIKSFDETKIKINVKMKNFLDKLSE